MIVMENVNYRPWKTHEKKKEKPENKKKNFLMENRLKRLQLENFHKSSTKHKQTHTSIQLQIFSIKFYEKKKYHKCQDNV